MQAKMWTLGSCLGHIAIRTRRVNFQIRHMLLSRSMSTAERIVSSHLLLVPIKVAPGRFPSYHSCTRACLREELISFLTRVTISEKVRHPPCIESLCLPSRARPFAISFRTHSHATVSTEQDLMIGFQAI
ncbi:hypothetical protein TNCV_2571651 [Trichonephila clavipes]|nr:hypothetical protein TNCV_2571651 [Trichonephila clavipes]